MAAPRRTPFEIERQRTEIAQRYLQRQTQAAIAQAIGISRAMVAYDLAAIQAGWRQSAETDIAQRKAEDLARIDAIEREYWRAWEASHDPWPEPAAPEAYEGELALRRAQKTANGKKVERTGFAGYLQGVQWCIEQRARLLGYLPAAASTVPAMAQQGDDADDYAGADDATLARELARYARQLVSAGEAPAEQSAGAGPVSMDAASTIGPTAAAG